MADVVLSKQKIADGKTERLREWAAEVQNRRDEAVVTLRDEGMHSETAFVEHTDDGDFLVYYMKADDIDAVYEALEDSSHDIDEDHERVLMDVLEDGEEVGDYEFLYHLENPDRP
ncbi:DUF6176 family protein [Halobacterium jilantaiense]|uniref:Uncharacterized protein n=1 Tax=Halobacterium jilantaiense TaxID=355548 RepID=A0A1I0NQL1_9EURY|nr:DUF6176 family protein [Halobacterium jilantaiense]SEW03190.1 hypothetical protein SAMN04487945_1035 [Halobacterium jilantaiense]